MEGIGIVNHSFYITNAELSRSSILQEVMIRQKESKQLSQIATDIAKAIPLVSFFDPKEATYIYGREFVIMSKEKLEELLDKIDE